MLGRSYLNSVLPLGEVDLLLALALGLQGSLVLGETAAESTGELGAEVKRSVLLALVEQAELSALVGVDDGQNASDRLANVVAVKRRYISIPVLVPGSLRMCAHFFHVGGRYVGFCALSESFFSAWILLSFGRVPLVSLL